MIDFGQTAPLALYQMNIPLNHIHGVLITHLHSDHTGGLEELAFQSMYRYGHQNGKIKLFIAETLVDCLWENTLKAGLLYNKGGINSLEQYFEVHPIKEKERIIINEGLSFELIQTDHIPEKPSYSVFINDNIFYSADITFSPSLLEHVVYERKCDVILHDCQLKGVGLVHTTLDELLSLPEDIQSRIYLMHYDDEMPEFMGRTGQMQVIEQTKLYEF